jgi:hypothetical protein
MPIPNELWQGRLCGYSVGSSLGAIHCKAALEMALKKIKKRTAKALIHHRSGDPGLIVAFSIAALFTLGC